MSEPDRELPPRTEAAERALDDYLRRREAGEEVDVGAFCEAHPELARDVRDWEAARARIGAILALGVGGGDLTGSPKSVAERCADLYGTSSDGGPALEGSEVEGEGRPPSSASSSSSALDAAVAELSQRRSARARLNVVGEVGKGGMARVLKVWDRDLKRHLAMKVATLGEGFRPDPGDATARRVGRFLEEAHVTAQLDHPAIVPVHELGLDEHGRPYFTMRLVRGRDLSEVFARARRGEDGWTLARAVDVLMRVCEALAYAHSKGVVHRDLKPANIRVGRFGEVYVMDWGLAKVLRGENPAAPPRVWEESADLRIQPALRDVSPADAALITHEGQVLGTPAYMAPEQARGDLLAIGPWTDVYAVGAMLYELLTGAAPYAERARKLAAREIVSRVLSAAPKRVGEVAPAAPRELAAVCEKAMARSWSARYRTMLELADDLRAWRDDRQGSAWRDAPPRRLVKLVRRRPVAATAVVAASLVLAIASLGFEGMRESQARAERATSEKAALERERERAALLADLERTGRGSLAFGDDLDPPTSGDAQSAREIAATFAELGLDLGGGSSPGELASAIDAWRPVEEREVLVRALLDLTRHVIGASSAGALGDTEIAAMEPRLRDVVGGLSGYAMSDRALSAHDLWRATGEDRLDLSPDAVSGARREELPLLSYVAFRMKRWEEADVLIDQGLRRAPGDYWLHYARARLADVKGQRPLAIEHLRFAVAVRPDSFGARNDLAVMLLRSGESEAARETLEDALEVDPGKATTLLNYGLVLERLGRLDEAIACTAAARAIDPGSFEAAHNLGFFQRKRAANAGDVAENAEAAGVLAQATAMRPGSPAGYYQLARTLSEAMEDEEALRVLAVGLERVPGARELRCARAESLFWLGHVDEAWDLVLDLLGADPDWAPALSVARDLILDELPAGEDRARRERELDEVCSR